MSSNAGAAGFAWTTVGLTAIFFAAQAARLRKAGRATGRVLPAVGAALGILGTFLSLWGVLAFYNPGTIPPIPRLASASSAVQPALAPAPVQLSSPLPDQLAAVPGRVVPALPGAVVTDPSLQLHANLASVAMMLGVGISGSSQMGSLPSSVYVQPDGLVTAGNSSFSVLPSYMRLSYTLTDGGQNFVVIITDIQSGMSVQFDSSTRRVSND
jgi:hypothetical protein